MPIATKKGIVVWVKLVILYLLNDFGLLYVSLFYEKYNHNIIIQYVCWICVK